MKKKIYSVFSKIPIINVLTKLIIKPILFCSPGIADGAYDDLFEYVLKPVFIKMGVENDLIMNYMSKFYLSGVTAIVNEWINRDCQDDVLFVVEIIIACIPQQTS